MKNDLISRQAAIDLVHKNYDTILDFKSDGRTVASSFEDIINTLPSTQPEPCGDMVSREYLKEHIEACWINGRPRHAPEFNELLSWIDDVPPAQPEQRWIPVSERPPKEGQDVLITKEGFKIKGYEQEVIKAKRSADPRSGKIEWWSEFGTLTDKAVLAWMPLPKPYQEGEQEE